MANWISSKLKVAETFLQQIDQQAAESLGKNDKPRSEELSSETLRKSSEAVPLKDQLKKKKGPEINDLLGKSRSDHNSNSFSSGNNSNNRENKEVGALVVNVNPSVSPPKSGLTDSDWTELLSAPSQLAASAVNRSNGVSGIRGLRKDGQRHSGKNSSALEAKRSQKSPHGGFRTLQKSDAVSENKTNGGSFGGRQSDADDFRVMDTMQRNSSVVLGSDGVYSEGRQVDRKETSPGPSVENNNVANGKGNDMSELRGNKNYLQPKDSSADEVRSNNNKDHLVEIAPVTIDGVSDLMRDDRNKFRSNIGISNEPNIGQRSSPSLKKESPSISDGGSDSDTDSISTSDSESEREREERKRRRAQILAEKAAAKAVGAIKERENVVARLEGEKQSLEKILEERAKQQAQEASELQNSTMEMMEAVDIEKQKHKNTRMEAFARLAKLETANADLSRSLATAQWNLEVEINRVAELRQQIELREANIEELGRKISASHDTGNQLVALRGFQFGHEILEAEYSFVTEKLGRLQEKAKKLEANIEMTQKERENPTEVEVELKRRLSQLTDHLIQKQAQVEALLSEKATLLLRIEAVSKLLDENKSLLSASTSGDLETGNWEFSNSKLRPMFEERIQSGRKHLGSLVRQLDSIFCAGASFLRKNSTARICSLVYLLCLHFWVIYILMSHSSVSEEGKSGAVFSLENINNTGGV